MWHKIKTAFLHCVGLDFAEQAENDVRVAGRDRARQIASRYSRGSVRIQSGAFVTKGDIEIERVRARGYKFSQ